MARRRDFVRGSGAIARKRETSWFEFPPIRFALAGPDTATLVFSLNVPALAFRPFTVVRSHFVIGVESDQAAAIEQQQIGFGIAVVSDQAVAVGVTAVPTPIADMASNFWLLHQLLYGDASTLTDRTIPMVSRQIDSKAMRKVELGQDIVIVAETGSGSDGALVTVGGRMLVKNA